MRRQPSERKETRSQIQGVHFRRTSERHAARLRRHVRQLIFPPFQRRKKPMRKADDRSAVELSKQGAEPPLRDVRLLRAWKMVPIASLLAAKSQEHLTCVGMQ